MFSYNPCSNNAIYYRNARKYIYLYLSFNCIFYVKYILNRKNNTFFKGNKTESNDILSADLVHPKVKKRYSSNVVLQEGNLINK